jgi:hypothetical protein
MSAELVAAASALGGAASTALVSAMVNDVWGSVRARVARVFGRADNNATTSSSVIAVLDEANEAISRTTGAERAAEVALKEPALQEAIANLLIADASLIPRVRALLAELGNLQGGDGSQIALASDDAQQAVQYRGIQENEFRRGKD